MADAQAPTRVRAVFARHAASLLVVRDGVAGPEVLMGVRGRGHRFMPNRLVFPGGAVDPGDGTAAAASEPRPEVLAALGAATRPRLARGVVLCAARELEEETGMTLAEAPGRPPRLDRVDYLCRAVTPPENPMRFNARFLVVPAEAVGGTMQDSRELEGVGFRVVDEVVEQDLAVATKAVLQRFQAWWAARTGGEVPAAMVFRKRAWRLER